MKSFLTALILCGLVTSAHADYWTRHSLDRAIDQLRMQAQYERAVQRYLYAPIDVTGERRWRVYQRCAKRYGADNERCW